MTAHVASSSGQKLFFSESLNDPKFSMMNDPKYSEMLNDPKSSSLDPVSFRSSHHDLFVYDDDNEVAELGDTDVACDFGGDFGGF